MFRPQNEHRAQRAVKPKAGSKTVDGKSFLLNPLGCDLDRREGPSDVMKRASQEMYRELKRVHFLLVCEGFMCTSTKAFPFKPSVRDRARVRRDSGDKRGWRFALGVREMTSKPVKKLSIRVDIFGTT